MAITRRLTQFVLNRRASNRQWPLVLGMIHVPPLPGTPHYRPEAGGMRSILEKVHRETAIYTEAGVVRSLTAS